MIYWAWNNTLSVIQQSIIMSKHGAKIELFDNIKALFVRKNTADAAKPKDQNKTIGTIIVVVVTAAVAAALLLWWPTRS